MDKKISVKAFMTAHKKAIGISAGLLCIVIAAVVGVLVALRVDIFRVGRVAQIDLGASQAQVSAVLGEPHKIDADGDSVVWHYYERKLRGRLSENNREDAVLNVPDGTEYQEIRISFDAHGVCEVLLDKKHFFSATDEYATAAKTVKRVQTAPLDAFEQDISDGDRALIPTDDTRRAAYSAYYTDGSFYRARIGEVNGTSRDTVLKDGRKIFRLRWQDRFAQYDVQGQVTLLGRIDAENTLTAVYANKSRIDVPDIVAEIAVSAFDGCTSLNVLSLPAGLKRIGASAFADCEGLSQVHITDLAGWCTVIFENAYSNPLYYAHALYLDGELVTSLVLPEGVTAVSDYAFRGAGCFCEITLPQGLETIGVSAFADCRGVEHVILPEGVKSLGRGAFEGCDKLREVVLPESIEKLEHSVFSGCGALEKVSIPDRVSVIGDYAFFGCGSMKELAIGSGLQYIGDSAFAGCGGLKSIVVHPENHMYHSAGNCLIETESGTLILGCAESRIPVDGSVTAIGRYAFIRCARLTDITIPKSVTMIGSYAFYSCTGLVRIFYEGTAEEWGAVSKGTGWDEETGAYVVYFTDETRSGN